MSTGEGHISDQTATEDTSSVSASAFEEASGGRDDFEEAEAVKEPLSSTFGGQGRQTKPEPAQAPQAPKSIDNSARALHNIALYGSVSPSTLTAMGMNHLNVGIRELEGTLSTVEDMRKHYQKELRRTGYGKFAGLLAETTLMTFFGYSSVENFTGLQGSSTAVAANTSISGGISAVRAGVGYVLMKNSEEAFAKGNKWRGIGFLSMGIGLATLHAVFVALGFAGDYAEEARDDARAKLSGIADDREEILTEMNAERSVIRAQIEAIDARVEEIRSGAASTTIADIDAEIARLEQANVDIANEPVFNDGRETEGDRRARAQLDENSRNITRLRAEKIELLSNPEDLLSNEQRAILDSNMQRRNALIAEEAAVEARFAPDLNSLETSRQVHDAKLSAVSTNNNWEVMLNNKEVLIEGAANVAAITIVNWCAATFGHKQDEIKALLNGQRSNPWRFKKKGDEQTQETELARDFMGYNFAQERDQHVINAKRLEELKAAIREPEALKTEMLGAMQTYYGTLLEMLHDAQEAGKISDELYQTRLDALNKAYENAVDSVSKGDLLERIEQLIITKKTPDNTKELPIIESPKDPRFKKLEINALFLTPDGEIMRKRKPKKRFPSNGPKASA